MSEESNSKCPVRLHANEDMNGNGNGTADNLSSAPFWDRLWGSTASSNENQCKEEVIASPISSSTVPSSLEEAAAYAQTPQVDQKFPLALDRQVSSIARGMPRVLYLPYRIIKTGPPPRLDGYTRQNNKCIMP